MSKNEVKLSFELLKQLEAKDKLINALKNEVATLYNLAIDTMTEEEFDNYDCELAARRKIENEM